MSTGRTVTNAVLLAVFAFFCVIGMELFAFNIGQANPLSHNYKVNALFPDANGLPSAADVRVAGVVVGKVTDISHDRSYPGYTVVTMSLSDDKANPIYHNGGAAIRPKTLLGEKYVELTIGDQTSDAVANNGFMDPGSGSKSVENDEIFNAFDKDTRAAQQKVLKALNDALDGRATDVHTLLPQLDTVIQNLLPVAKVYEKDNSTVDSIFTNLDKVMQTLADEHTQLADFLSNGSQALGAINARDGSLVTTLTEATRVQDEIISVVAPTVNAQQQSINKLSPTIAELHRFVDQVIYPQPACGNKPCGLVELLSGTLNGQINYPNDQLTVTGICAKGKPGPDSCEGMYVTDEYDSLFSNPPNAYKTGNPSEHSALNIVLAEQCDTVASTVNPLPVILGQRIGDTLSQIAGANCKAGAGASQASTSGGAAATANGAASATLAALTGAGG